MKKPVVPLRKQIVPINKLKVPKVLFKYSNVNKEKIDTLLERKIYIPSVKTFNDPFDCNIPTRYPSYQLTDENIYLKLMQMARMKFPNASETEIHAKAFEAQREDLMNNSYHLEKVDQINFEKLAITYGVVCLTPFCDNIPMWSYYGASHEGICIGYNTQELLKAKVFNWGGKVIYRNEFPEYPLFDKDLDLTFINILFTKGKMWKHEKEYRFVHKFGRGNKMDIPVSAVQEIIFGCKFTAEERLKLIPKIISSYPDITISEMTVSKSQFKLEKNIVYASKGIQSINGLS